MRATQRSMLLYLVVQERFLSKKALKDADNPLPSLLSLSLFYTYMHPDKPFLFRDV